MRENLARAGRSYAWNLHLIRQTGFADAGLIRPRRLLPVAFRFCLHGRAQELEKEDYTHECS